MLNNTEDIVKHFRWWGHFSTRDPHVFIDITKEVAVEVKGSLIAEATAILHGGLIYDYIIFKRVWTHPHSVLILFYHPGTRKIELSLKLVEEARTYWTAIQLEDKELKPLKRGT
jgi:hypothetical protein